MLDRLKGFFLHISVLLIFLFFPSFASAQQSAMNYFVDGVEAFEAGSYRKAIRSLEKAIELDPLNLEFDFYSLSFFSLLLWYLIKF